MLKSECLIESLQLILKENKTQICLLLDIDGVSCPSVSWEIDIKMTTNEYIESKSKLNCTQEIIQLINMVAKLQIPIYLATGRTLNCEDVTWNMFKRAKVDHLINKIQFYPFKEWSRLEYLIYKFDAVEELRKIYSSIIVIDDDNEVVNFLSTQYENNPDIIIVHYKTMETIKNEV